MRQLCGRESGGKRREEARERRGGQPEDRTELRRGREGRRTTCALWEGSGSGPVDPFFPAPLFWAWEVWAASQEEPGVPGAVWAQLGAQAASTLPTHILLPH